MGVLDTILDFVAAVAWPVVALTAILVLLDPIRDRIRNMSSVSGPAGTGAKFFAAVATAGMALEAIGQDSEEPSTDEDATVSPPAGNVTADAVVMSRDELQMLVTEFAEAGWAIRDLGAFREPPSPVVGWNAEGKPFIKVWKGSRHSADREALDQWQALAMARSRLNSARKEFMSAAASGDPQRIASAHVAESLAADAVSAAERSLMES